MNKKRKNTQEKCLYERLFKIEKKNNTVDLTGSLSIVNNVASESYFEKEVFQLTFTTNTSQTYNMLVTANEYICESEVNKLKERLNITIEGSGMNFKVLDFEKDFTICFDEKHSGFINTHTVQNGSVCFFKEK